jgi:hypothetical protein
MKGKPYVRANVNSTAYDSDDRILAVTQWEGPYDDGCEILLDNTDGTFTGLSLQGAKVELGFGVRGIVA